MESGRNKVIVLTGATSGIGRAVALNLGRSGARLALLGRNIIRGQRLAERISGRGHDTEAVFYQVDLSSLTEVRRVVAQLKKRYGQVDILINNAGARFDTFHKTSEGIERTFATNHLGHFLLTVLLLEHLLRAPSARVITVGSGAHLSIHRSPEWLLTEKTYERRQAYGISKLANIIFAYELARRLSGTAVTSNAVDPGSVATNLARNNGLVPWLRHLIHCILKGQLTSRHAAQGIVNIALADELASVTGQYFRQRTPVSSSQLSHDVLLARQLWSLSVQLTEPHVSVENVWGIIQPGEGP